MIELWAKHNWQLMQPARHLYYSMSNSRQGPLSKHSVIQDFDFLHMHTPTKVTDISVSYLPVSFDTLQL